MARILVEYEKALSGKRDSGAGVSGVNGSGADISGVNGSVADGFSTGVSSGEGSGVSDVPGRTASGLLGGLEDFPNVVDENGEPADSFDSDRPDLRFSRPFSGPEFEAELAAVEARHTNADGTRKATWMKAPNGNPTNLTHRQWLQVRTESFRKWFGDWEASLPLPNSARSFDDVRGILTSLSGRVFTNRSSGLQGSLSKNSINKILSGKAHAKSVSLPAHLHAAANIIELFERGEVLQSDPGRKGEVKTSHKVFAPFVFEGTPLVAKVTLHEYTRNGGNRIYSVEAMETLNPAVNSAPVGLDQQSNPLPDSVLARLREMASSVNPENVSKFVDDNFEPKVFYPRLRNRSSIFDIGGVFDGPRSGISADSGWLGTGFYFYGEASELDGLGAGYGPDRYPVFLNVRSPHYATLSENRRLAGEGDFEAIREFSLGLRDEGKDGVYYNGDLREEAVVFDPRQIKLATDTTGLSDSAPSDLRFSRPFEGEDDRYLAVLHNLSEDNLLASARLGGLAVPSLAITDVRNLYGIYGEITLIGDPSLADPQQPGNKVFSTDAWTPTHPPAVVQGSREDFERFWDEVVALSGWGEKAPSLESLLSSLPNLAPHGMEFDKEANDDSIPKPYLTVPGTLSRAYLREANPSEPSRDDMMGWLNAKLSTHNLWRGIEDGVNPDGSPRIVPYNLENVVRHLTRAIRYFGKTERFRFSGFKALAAKEYGTLDELKAARENITNQTEAIMADRELKQELSDILDLLGDRETSFYDSFYKALVDYAGGNSDAFSSLVELTPGMKSRLDAFISHFRSLPVAYFEGKRFFFPIFRNSFCFHALFPSFYTIMKENKVLAFRDLRIKKRLDEISERLNGTLSVPGRIRAAVVEYLETHYPPSWDGSERSVPLAKRGGGDERDLLSSLQTRLSALEREVAALRGQRAPVAPVKRSAVSEYIHANPGSGVKPQTLFPNSK